LPSEEDLVWLLENDADLVADDCQAMMRKADELSCAAAEAEAAGRDALTLEAQAMDMAERAVYLADRLQLPHLQATALLNLATLVGPTPKALDMLHKALALADDNEDLILVCIALGKIAAVHCKLGDVDAGLECLETTRKVAVAHEMLWLLGLVYCSYTELLIEHGEDEKVAALLPPFPSPSPYSLFSPPPPSPTPPLSL
jgi:ATP/maltotriose-dependent transcriptional regulator MalT